LSKASQLLATIESTNWEIFDAIAKLTDERQAAAQVIRSSITHALQSDEHVTSLGPTLKEAQHKAVRLLTQTSGQSSVVSGQLGKEPSAVSGQQTSVKSAKLLGQLIGVSVEEALQKLTELKANSGEERIKVDLTWTSGADG